MRDVLAPLYITLLNKVNEFLLSSVSYNFNCLLQLFPGNEFLLQICMITAKISTFHMTTSLGKMLISIELLLRKKK